MSVCTSRGSNFELEYHIALAGLPVKGDAAVVREVRADAVNDDLVFMMGHAQGFAIKGVGRSRVQVIWREKVQLLRKHAMVEPISAHCNANLGIYGQGLRLSDDLEGAT